MKHLINELRDFYYKVILRRRVMKAISCAEKSERTIDLKSLGYTHTVGFTNKSGRYGGYVMVKCFRGAELKRDIKKMVGQVYFEPNVEIDFPEGDIDVVGKSLKMPIHFKSGDESFKDEIEIWSSVL